MRVACLVLVVFAAAACGGDKDEVTKDTTDTAVEETAGDDTVGDITVDVEPEVPGEVVDPCPALCAAAKDGPAKCGTIESCDCGACAEGFECDDDTNECECAPKCVDDEGVKFQCGDDGCGKSCGKCKYGECIDHVCVCEPSCEGKTCGPDGCGGNCGVCEGETSVCAKDMNCYAPCGEPESYGDLVQKINFLARGHGGHPGEALDVDLDPETCAPEGDCEAGLNNGFSKLLDQIGAMADIDAELAKMLDGGDIALLAENIGFNTDGDAFTINMYIGEPVADKEVCDFQTEKCSYFVLADSYDPSADCVPLISFDNVKVDDGILTAGGPDYLFVISLPIMDNIVLVLTVNMAQLYGEVSGEGDAMTITKGIIGGALRKDKLMEAVDLIPDDAGLPVSKDMIKNILEMTVKPDLDTDGDDVLDAASLALKFGTIAGAIAGFPPTDKECATACEGKECGDGGEIGCDCGACADPKPTCNVDGLCEE